MKTRIITLLAVVIFAGFAGRAEARDYCGGHHHHHGSSFGFSFGVPLFYSRPVYSYRPAYSYYPYPTNSWYGSRYYSPAVRTSSMSADVQVALARRGYYHGAIDGIIGTMSRSAIRRYQSSRGLPITGVIDYPLLRTLGLR